MAGCVAQRKVEEHSRDIAKKYREHAVLIDR